MARRIGALLSLSVGLLLMTALLAEPPAVIDARQSDDPASPAEGEAVQPTPTAAANAFLVAHATLDELPDGPVVVNAATILLPPGYSTQPFANPGPTILAIQEGSITLDAEAASVGNVLVTEVLGVEIQTAEPGPISGLVVRQGQQILVPANARAELRNEGSTTVRLLFLSIVPANVEA